MLILIDRTCDVNCVVNITSLPGTNQGACLGRTGKEMHMLGKEILVIMLAGVLSMGLVGAAFAGGNNAVGTEAGNWQYSFDRPESKASAAAKAHQYDSEVLAAVGTEAGHWQYNFDAPDTLAVKAARNHDYNSSSLATVGTEAGNWEYRFSPQDKQEATADNDKRGSICSNC